MKSFVIFVCLFGFAFAEVLDSCGAPPTKRPIDCCVGVTRFVKDEYLNSCSASCKEDQCCQGDCLATYLRILKNGVFDHKTAITSVTEAFAGHPEWTKVALEAVNNCVAKTVTLRFIPGTPCEFHINGRMTLCIQKELFANCPVLADEPECSNTKRYFSCISLNA